MTIQPIVEGHGEVAAVPVLLRRLLAEARTTGVDVGRPIRRARSQLATEDGLARSIALARIQPNCASILVLFDGDDDARRIWGRTRSAGRRPPRGNALRRVHRPSRVRVLVLGNAGLAATQGGRRRRQGPSPARSAQRRQGRNVAPDAGQRLQGDEAPSRVQRPVLPFGRLQEVPFLPQADDLIRSGADGFEEASSRLASSVMGQRACLRRGMATQSTRRRKAWLPGPRVVESRPGRRGVDSTTRHNPMAARAHAGWMAYAAYLPLNR